MLVTQLQSFCGFFIAAYRKLLQHGNTRYLYHVLRIHECECTLFVSPLFYSANLVSPLFYSADLEIEKTSTALIEVTWEIWKLAKLARQKGQYFFDPRNITVFLVEINNIMAGEYRVEVVAVYAVCTKYVEM